MAQYDITITNGTGSESVKPGQYSVTATYAPGYDATTLNPTTFTATETTSAGAFTISATGTLSITFNETGAAGGTPITSGTVVMTDQTGNTQYGPVIQIDSNGTAVFNNVPWGSADSPYTLYFKQLTSDENHEPYPDVFTIGMGDQTQQEYVINEHVPVLQNFTLTDANYTGLPVYNAVLSLDNDNQN